jgi:hypothetical protein
MVGKRLRKASDETDELSDALAVGIFRGRNYCLRIMGRWTVDLGVPNPSRV